MRILKIASICCVILGAVGVVHKLLPLFSKPPTISADGKQSVSKSDDSSREAVASYLSEDQRLKLFNLERADLRLGKALNDWQTGIRMADADRLRAELADDFAAAVPVIPTLPAATTQNTNYHFQRLESSERVDAEGFMHWVAALRQHFETIQTAEFPRDRNDAAILEGRGTITESAGVFRIAGTGKDGGPIELSGRYLLRHQGMDDGFADINHWIHGVTLQDVRLIRAESIFFEETTASCGVDVDLRDHWKDPNDYAVHNGGVYLGRVNRDDHLDLIVTDRRRVFLYFGKGDGTFTQSDWQPTLGEQEFPTERTKVVYAAIFDATGDGHNDVLCFGTLYQWDNDAETLVAIPSAPRLPNVDLALCDYDRDGLIDIYFLNCGPPPSRFPELSFFDDHRVKGRANVLVRNLGGGQFEDVTPTTNASPAFGRQFAAVFFYANDDDWPDLFGASEFGRNLFLVNRSGYFIEGDSVDPVWGGFSMGVASGDLDGDGKSDLYVSNMYSKAGHRIYHHLDLSVYPESARPMFMASVNGNRHYRSRGDSTFEDVSMASGVNAVGWASSGAIADFDLDGWLDVYAPCGHRSVDRSKPDG